MHQSTRRSVPRRSGQSRPNAILRLSRPTPRTFSSSSLAKSCSCWGTLRSAAALCTMVLALLIVAGVRWRRLRVGVGYRCCLLCCRLLYVWVRGSVSRSLGRSAQPARPSTHTRAVASRASLGLGVSWWDWPEFIRKGRVGLPRRFGCDDQRERHRRRDARTRTARRRYADGKS